MSQPWPCPICSGKGTITLPSEVCQSMSYEPPPKTCHACSGKGIVWEPEPDCPIGELDYRPVPPKHTFFVKTRYVFTGKGKPLPFNLDEDDLPVRIRSDVSPAT